ncbi:hypothetical protein ACWFR1_28295 [Streptomyces sp. NPDC055103]
MEAPTEESLYRLGGAATLERVPPAARVAKASTRYWPPTLHRPVEEGHRVGEILVVGPR